MSILTYIKSIPLFSTPLEAIAWGRQRGLTGYHSHAFNIRTGYMGGTNHRQTMKHYAVPANQTTTIPQPTIPIPTPPTTPTTSTTPPPPSPLPTGGTGGGY
tara:strand:+ start:920 stop:1222 length:303 start_codon:yes stop_codon:yes gene_type:complete